jgi:hypothetical protein
MGKLREQIEQLKINHNSCNFYYLHHFTFKKEYMLIKNGNIYVVHYNNKFTSFIYKTRYYHPIDCWFDMIAKIDNNKSMALLNIRNNDSNFISTYIEQVLKGNEMYLI